MKKYKWPINVRKQFKIVSRREMKIKTTSRFYLTPIRMDDEENKQQKMLVRCPSTNEWMKKMRYIYTMEFYSAIKKNEIVICWEMELVILNEITQFYTEKYNIFSHLWKLGRKNK
jgi:hypothetical protein